MKNRLINQIRTKLGLSSSSFSLTSSSQVSQVSCSAHLKPVRTAFTIIELLVVIAVIAALAAITVIAYVGITNQAHKVALSSGLSESVKALENYKTTNGITSSETYPTKLSDMTNLKLDNSINWTYYVPSTTDNTQNTSYCLQGTINGITQSVSSTDSSVQTKPCLENGLVGWWKLNGNANDSSGNGNNGTINGGVTSATGEDGVAGHAYSFDGTSGYISTPASTSPSTVYAISLWAKQTAFLSNPNPYAKILFGGNDSNADLYDMGSSYRVFSNNTPQGLLATPDNIKNWNHVVISINNNVGSLYVNGLFQATSSSFPLTIFTNKNIGGGPVASGSRWFNGLIDDVRIYGRALSASEISALYSAGAQ